MPCQAIPITETVRKARWTLLGHVLCMADDAPPVLSMRFAITAAEQSRGRRGRPRTNIEQYRMIYNNLTLDSK